MCWMPSPLYLRRYSSIWLLSSAHSLIGMRILPQGEVSARLSQAGQLALDVEEADLRKLKVCA